MVKDFVIESRQGRFEERAIELERQEWRARRQRLNDSVLVSLYIDLDIKRKLVALHQGIHSDHRDRQFSVPHPGIVSIAVRDGFPPLPGERAHLVLAIRHL